MLDDKVEGVLRIAGVDPTRVEAVLVTDVPGDLAKVLGQLDRVIRFKTAASAFSYLLPLDPRWNRPQRLHPLLLVKIRSLESGQCRAFRGQSRNVQRCRHTRPRCPFLNETVTPGGHVRKSAYSVTDSTALEAH
jgi:hypothetical protein